MVFSGLFPIDGDDFENLRDSLEQAQAQRRVDQLHARVVGCARVRVPLRLPRPAPHGDREGAPRARVRPGADRHRAERRVPGHQTDGEITVVDNPADLPPVQKIDFIEEPIFKVSIITPKEYTGALMDLCQQRRGEMKKMEYLSPERVELDYEVPLAEVVVDFFDQMKSAPGLRQPRLRAHGLHARQPRQGRHPAQRHPGRRVLHDRAPRERSTYGAGCARSSRS
jgi:GTP-binding protein LepA